MIRNEQVVLRKGDRLAHLCADVTNYLVCVRVCGFVLRRKKPFGRWEARVPLLCHWGRCEGHCRGAGQLPQVTRHHLNQKWPGAARFPVALFLGWCNKRWYMQCPISDIISARYIHMCRKQKHRSAKMYRGFTVVMSMLCGGVSW